MYDFIKISCILPDTKPLLDSLDFIQEYNRNTSEISEESIFKFGNMVIKVFPRGLVLILGSVHKQFNNGENCNDYTLSNFIQTIEELSGALDLNLWTYKPDIVEVGVNIQPPINTSLFLRYALFHGKKCFKDVSVRGNGDYRQVEYKQYIVKLYDKGEQYGNPNQLLRFEIKILADMLRSLNINNLYDLLKTENIELFRQKLEFHFNEILFIDPTIKRNNLTPNQLSKLVKWSNPNYWNELNDGITKTTKNTPRREFAQCKKLIKENSEDIQGQIKNLIIQKWGILVNLSEEEIIQRMGNFSTSIIQQIFPNISTCKVTGLDISMQRSKSKFLSIAGIRYYFDNNKKIQKDLLLRLSDKWKDSPQEVQFSEIAHSIRNEYYNPKNNTLLRIKRIESYPMLFDLRTVIDPKYFNIAGLNS